MGYWIIYAKNIDKLIDLQENFVKALQCSLMSSLFGRKQQFTAMFITLRQITLSLQSHKRFVVMIQFQ